MRFELWQLQQVEATFYYSINVGIIDTGPIRFRNDITNGMIADDVCISMREVDRIVEHLQRELDLILCEVYPLPPQLRPKLVISVIRSTATIRLVWETSDE